MIEFSLSGDSIVFVAEGDNAINRLSDLVGHHDPAIAEEGTIRKRFAKSLAASFMFTARKYAIIISKKVE